MSGVIFKLKFKKNKKGDSQKFFICQIALKLQSENMPKLSNRIGCNYSPFSLVNKQTESMTEKFFKESF